MNWTVDFLDEAEKDMKRLDPSVRVRVLKGIQKVAQNPFPPIRAATARHWATKAA